MQKKEKENSILNGSSYGYNDNFSQRQMWEEIASDLNGEFKIKFTSSKELEIHNISIPHKNWEINISVSDKSSAKIPNDLLCTSRI